jgi:membrane protease YdiL (CAAX protease family)
MHGFLDSSPAARAVASTGKWVGGVGPSLAAFLLVARDRGRRGVCSLLRRAVALRIGVWYMPALALLPALVILAHLLDVALGGRFPAKEILSTPWMIVPLFLVLVVMQASEEFGWRGYALDRLQTRQSALVASLFLGVVWAIWHLPMFTVAGFAQFEHGVPYAQFAVTLIAVSVLITWMQNGTSGSLVPAFCCHAMVNLTGEVLPLWKENDGQSDQRAWLIANGLLIVCALVVVKVAGAKQLRRRDPVRRTHHG